MSVVAPWFTAACTVNLKVTTGALLVSQTAIERLRLDVVCMSLGYAEIKCMCGNGIHARIALQKLMTNCIMWPIHQFS